MERLRRQQHLTAGFGYWSDDERDTDKDKDKGKDANPTRDEDGGKGGKDGRRTRAGGKAVLLPNSQFLHLLLRAQVESVMRSLHDEVATSWARRQEEQRAQRAAYDAALAAIRACVGKLWHFSRVEVFGSFATGLLDPSSDLDLVVCFRYGHVLPFTSPLLASWLAPPPHFYLVVCSVCVSDECQNLLGVKGVVPLLYMLAEYLAKEAGHVIQITNVLVHARVPLIKVYTNAPLIPRALS